MAFVTEHDATLSTPPVTQKRARRWSRYSNRTFYLFILPWLLGFLLLTVAPYLYALLMSFSNFDGISIWRWVGLQNYTGMLSDQDALYALGRTLLFTILIVPLSVLGGLGLAVLVDQHFRGIAIFRTIFYLPSVVPVVASAIAWRGMFSFDNGIINALIERFGLASVNWLADPYAFYATLIMILWGIGGGMLISLAGLQGVPTELKEAARMDGAGGWQVFWRITIPLLSPVLFFQCVINTIGALQTLIQPVLLAQSGGTSAAWAVPRGDSFYLIHVFEEFLFFQRFGYGSALLWVLFIVILAITILVLRTGAFWVYYEVDRG